MLNAPQKRRFISRHKELTIVVEPSVIVRSPKESLFTPGENIVFRNGVYETSDLDIYNFLVEHPAYGCLFETSE